MVSLYWRHIGSRTLAFQRTHYWNPKIQDGGDPPSWKSTLFDSTCSRKLLILEHCYEWSTSKISSLGPLLFLYYVNDIPSLIQCKSKLFADDIKLWQPINVSWQCSVVRRLLQSWHQTSDCACSVSDVLSKKYLEKPTTVIVYQDAHLSDTGCLRLAICIRDMDTTGYWC